MIDWNKISAPDAPGVYLFKSAGGKILYIGKANSLRARLAQHASAREEKGARLGLEADSIEFFACRNEADALILENTLIKQHRPHYNIDFKDSDYYAYLKVTAESFPRIIVTRKRQIRRGEKLIGPFVSGIGRSVALREVQRLFKLRVCRKLPNQSCLQYEMGFCSAPCIGKISREEYVANVRSAQAVLQGGTKVVEDQLRSQMSQASGRLDFERSIELRERLSVLQRIRQRQLMDEPSEGDEDFFGFVRTGGKTSCCVLKARKGLICSKELFSFEDLDGLGESAQAQFVLRYYDNNKPPRKAFSVVGNAEEQALQSILGGQGCSFVSPQKGSKLELVRLAEKNAALSQGVAGSSKEAIELQRALSLPTPPALIDCFDVSNFGGKQNVGSCVRLSDGKPDKQNYRRFLVRGVQGQDDFSSMREIVLRRYKGALAKGEKLPDLVIIDGGPGQLHSALDALGELAVDLPVVALAKKLEEIYLPDKLAPLLLPRSGAALKLVQRARDEAHRFALKYNRKRRQMEFTAEKQDAIYK